MAGEAMVRTARGTEIRLWPCDDDGVSLSVRDRHGEPILDPRLLPAEARALAAALDPAARAVVTAALELGRYEDFDADLCDACAPDDPADYLAARRRLGEAMRGYAVALAR